MDIEHREHEHESGTKHSMKRLYQRKKVNGKYQYSAVGWVCPDCGTMVKNWPSQTRSVAIRAGRGYDSSKDTFFSKFDGAFHQFLRFPR